MSILKMILKIIDLKTWFPTKDGLVKAVNTVSLDTGANDKVGLIGETGCGKTILCLSIIRLLPPSTKIEGAIVRQRPSKVERRRDEEDKGKGDCHDTPEPNDFAESGFESDQIAEAIQLHQGLDKRAAREKAIEMLESVKIPSPERRANEYPHQFSGGMKERAMIAMALACNPSISQMNQQRDVTIKTQVKLIKK